MPLRGSFTSGRNFHYIFNVVVVVKFVFMAAASQTSIFLTNAQNKRELVDLSIILCYIYLAPALSACDDPFCNTKFLKVQYLKYRVKIFMNKIVIIKREKEPMKNKVIFCVNPLCHGTHKGTGRIGCTPCRINITISIFGGIVGQGAVGERGGDK